MKLQEMEEDFEEEIELLRELPDPAALELEEIPIRPRKSDIAVSQPRPGLDPLGANRGRRTRADLASESTS